MASVYEKQKRLNDLHHALFDSTYWHTARLFDSVPQFWIDLSCFPELLDEAMKWFNLACDKKQFQITKCEPRLAILFVYTGDAKDYDLAEFFYQRSDEAYSRLSLRRLSQYMENAQWTFSPKNGSLECDIRCLRIHSVGLDTSDVLTVMHKIGIVTRAMKGRVSMAFHSVDEVSRIIWYPPSSRSCVIS